MAQVTIVINGQKYRLSCEAGEEGHIAQLADYVSKRILKIKQGVGSIGNDRLIVMSALMIADELWDAKREIREIQGKVDALKSPKVALEFQEAAERLESLKSKLLDLEDGSDGYNLDFVQEA